MGRGRLVDAGNGRFRAERGREMTFDSQTEGCVVDDDSGILYVNEEDVAMWRMSAEPDGGDARTAVERVADNPAIRDALEGVGIYTLWDGSVDGKGVGWGRRGWVRVDIGGSG